MGTIGIIGAMEVEVKELKEQMQITRQLTKAGMEFCEGILEGQDVVVVRSGVGKVNAAVCTQILIDVFDCLLYTSPSPRDGLLSRMPSSA